jgi:hypothetical protein
LGPEPVEHVSVDAHADQLLDRAIELADRHRPRPFAERGRVRVIERRIGPAGERLQFPALLASERFGKEFARGDSLFSRR